MDSFGDNIPEAAEFLIKALWIYTCYTKICTLQVESLPFLSSFRHFCIHCYPDRHARLKGYRFNLNFLIQMFHLLTDIKYKNTSSACSVSKY